MAQRVYATTADFETWDEDHEYTTPSNSRLRRASSTVDGLTRLSVYDVDEDGMPTDADVDQAFTEATCAQAAYWDDTDDVTGADSQAGPTKIGSVSFGGSGASGGATNTKSAASSRIAPEAVEILANAGLLSSNVDY